MNCLFAVHPTYLSLTAKNEKTRAFYDAYQRDVQEDDTDDFVHLNEEEMEDDEGGENEPPETVATSEIQARLREAARENKGKEQARYRHSLINLLF